MPAIDVFYDGGCPVCRIEVGYYRRIDRAGAVHWIDIESLTDAELPAGKTRDALLGRFHVRDQADGGWHVGVDAFARIWRTLGALFLIAATTAAFMAAAWGKLTGQPGICLVTRGPGVTNAAIGIHTITKIAFCRAKVVAVEDTIVITIFVGAAIST